MVVEEVEVEAVVEEEVAVEEAVVEDMVVVDMVAVVVEVLPQVILEEVSITTMVNMAYLIQMAKYTMEQGTWIVHITNGLKQKHMFQKCH